MYANVSNSYNTNTLRHVPTATPDDGLAAFGEQTGNRPLSVIRRVSQFSGEV